jgi:hypothetical protein
MNMMPILSEYQEGTRNAKVYKVASGDYGVIVYDAETDYNGFDSFATEELAEEFAEDWVLRAGQ